MVSRATHLSDEAISMLVSGELKPSQEARAQTHLAKCWPCRGRREAFEKAALQVVGFRKGRLESELPLDPGRRDLFLAELDHMLSQAASISRWSMMLDRIRALHLPNMNPIFASATIVCIAVLALLWVWQRHPVTINAAQLLSRAETSDLAVSHGRHGVVYQKIRFTTPSLKLERELYRDAQGKRRPRFEPVKEKSEPIRGVLASVGVDWEAPLSATSYREWHDTQPSISDEVSQESGDLLTLTTRSPHSRIQEESLTVRASDFHPIQRTIRTLDHGTIEIAELNYAVLGWNAVNESLFEDANPLTSLPRVADVHPALIRALPTHLQIDAAELQARIALNLSGADTEDQIVVSHSDDGVSVKGILPSNEQKQALVANLKLIPYVHADILSIEELSTRNGGQPSSAGPSGAQSYSPDQPSPLARYVEARGLTQEQLNQISQHLLDAGLTVQQGVSRIIELQERYSSSEQLDSQAWTNLQGLFETYSKSTVDGLDAERAAIGQIRIEPSISRGDHGGEGPLDVAALRQHVHQNQLLCQELISASPVAGRSAEAIAADLQHSISKIRTALAPIQKQAW